MPEHRWAAGVAFSHESIMYVSQHYGMPFGAVASVFAWERIGELLAHLGRKLLHIPLLRCESLCMHAYTFSTLRPTVTGMLMIISLPLLKTT